MLKGSTMDDSALREFIHVLSLDYKGAKTERILEILSVAAAASTAVIGTVPRNGAQEVTSDNNTGPTGPITRDCDPFAPGASFAPTTATPTDVQMNREAGVETRSSAEASATARLPPPITTSSRPRGSKGSHRHHPDAETS